MRALPDDPHYLLIAESNAKIFWQFHHQFKKDGYSETFMELITIMLQFDQIDRPTAAEIEFHPWVQDVDVATAEEMQKELARRYEIIKSDQNMDAQPTVNTAAESQERSNDALRSGHTKKPIGKFTPQFFQNTSFFT